jgi:uncharacterized protein YndB with AHSA1/START domain
MPDILHRLTIAAPPDSVHEAVSAKAGIERWWTGHPLEGEETPGGKLLFYFGGPDPIAAAEVLENTNERIVWRCVEGPDHWTGTTLTFVIKPRDDGDTTLLFTQAGWPEATEFMHLCSTHWASYLIGLKRGLEGGEFTPYPNGASCVGV